jgi:hypothetical protein
VIAIVFSASAAFLIHKHIQHNQAWLSMLADVRVGMDIENQSYWRNWVDTPNPQNSSGEIVNGSTYLRTAWAVAGLDLIQENPLGYGLMNSSFSHLAKEKWRDFYTDNGQHMVDTHSSWIDLTLALGIPAIGLLLYSLGKSFIDAFRYRAIWSSYVIWLIPTLVLGYTVVEVTFNLFYELLIFLAATFATLTRSSSSISETRGAEIKCDP